MKDYKKMRMCSYRLPDPGGKVVRGLLDEIERLQAAVNMAGRLVDQVGDTDLHYEAYRVYVERTGDEDCDACEPNDDDYGEAFIHAAGASPVQR